MRFEVLVDRSERPNKCTILPLEGKAEFDIVRFQRGKRLGPLTGEFLLHPEGESLDVVVKTLTSPPESLSAIDCTWKKLPGILANLVRPWPRLVRIPQGFVTAYPRRNKAGKDPVEGLATIEALFIAAAFLSDWDATLFAKYRFAPEFLQLNMTVFANYGLKTGTAG